MEHLVNFRQFGWVRMRGSRIVELCGRVKVNDLTLLPKVRLNVKTTDYSDLFSTDPIIADQIISYLMEFCWNLREKQSWKILSIDLSNNNHATDESTYFALCYC